MDDLQKKRLEGELTQIGEASRAAVDDLCSIPVPLGIHRELEAMGIPKDALALCTLPFMLLGQVTGGIYDLGGGIDDAIGCLSAISIYQADHPYWIETKNGSPIKPAVDQISRLMRAGFVEIVGAILSLDETYDRNLRSKLHPEEVSRIEGAARVTAMEVSRFVIEVAFSAMPARP